jgi:copper chaperone CopZ
MVCGGCEQAIDAALGKLPGVSSVAASHAQERVVVRFDPARVTRSQLEAAITGLGYTVGPPPHPLDPPAGSPAPAP